MAGYLQQVARRGMRIVAARSSAPSIRRTVPAARATSRVTAPSLDEAAPPSVPVESAYSHTADFASPLQDPPPPGPVAALDPVTTLPSPGTPRELLPLPRIELHHPRPEDPEDPADRGSDVTIEPVSAPIAASDPIQSLRPPAPTIATPAGPAALPRPPVLSVSQPSTPPRFTSTAVEKQLTRVPVLSAPAAKRPVQEAPVPEGRDAATPPRIAQAPADFAADEVESVSTPGRIPVANDAPAPPRLSASVANTQRERPREWYRPPPSPAPPSTGLTIERLELQIVESRDNRAAEPPAAPAPSPGSVWDLPNRRHQGMVR